MRGITFVSLGVLLLLAPSCGGNNEGLFDQGSNPGAGGAIDAAAGGSAGLGGSAGMGGGDASVGGAAGSGGSVPEAGPDVMADTADAGACPPDAKLCQGACVSKQDPAFGCAAESCTPCSAAPHAVSACDNGACAIASCDNGYDDCNGQVADGCEANVVTDVEHCGGCAQPCSSAGGTSACSQGKCVMIACNPGRGDCNHEPSDGCEIDLTKDALSCGSCGIVCTYPNAYGVCNAGQCAMGACHAGFGNCNSTPTDGCETNVTNNIQHCSGCNMHCVFANATGACSNSQCVIASCSADFGNCDGIAANGCEVNLKQNASHCGMCGNSCAGFPCVGGQCTSPALPQKICDSGAGAYDIAVDGTFVYWGSCAGIQRVNKTGGTPAALASGVANGIAIDAARVYWADTSAKSIRSVPLAGGAGATLVSGLTYPWRVVSNGVSVFYTDNGAGAVSRVPAAGGAATALATALGGAAGIAVDAANVYFTTNTAGSVAKVPLAGGPVTTLASGESTPMRVAVDGTHVYFTTYVAGGAVKKVPIAGGPVVTLAAAEYPIAVIVDSGWVYWTDATTVKKIAATGGNQVVLASNQGSPNCLAVDSARLYWIDYTAGAVLAAAK